MTTGAPEGAWSALVRPSESPGRERWAVSAQGTRVRFADGIDAYCATSGLWNVPLGYGRPEIADAVARALRDASYLTLFRRSHPLAEAAAERVLEFTGMSLSRLIYSTSGGAANDAVMKLARQFWAIAGQPQRRIIVGLRGSYHGLTYGAHALSGDELGQTSYGVDRRDIRHVPFDDEGEALATLLAREGERVAAVVLEPVLGTGAIVVPAPFLAAVQALRDEHRFLVVADEVATGFGRTGRRFASAGWDPDALVLSKALTNGTCAAAVVAVGKRVASAFEDADVPFVHGETQAGTPASCAAILAAIDLYEALDLDARFQEVSARLDAVVERLLRHPRVSDASGTGALRAVTVAPMSAARPLDVIDLVERVRRRGVIVHPAPSGIQFIPPAVSTPADVDLIAVAVEGALDDQEGS